MSGFNLTEWAIRHKALAIYFMITSVRAVTMSPGPMSVQTRLGSRQC